MVRISITKKSVIFDANDDLNLKPEEKDIDDVHLLTIEMKKQASKQQSQSIDSATTRIIWFPNVVWYTFLHLFAAIGLYLCVFHAKWPTVAFSFALYIASGLGITAGAHRLWAHRSYKANLPYRIMLMIFNCIALQNHVIEWARDHRCHHKWSETDADPHNTNRGMFFAHMGWLMTKKHPEVQRKGKMLDLADLESDPVLRFQKRFYLPIALTLCLAMPTLVPWYFWGESPFVAYFVCGVFRYAFVLHMTWCVNSVAHWFGNKPYDRRIRPSQNILTSIGALGEGWHNYHHTFPFDYKTAELPYAFNFSTAFIDAFALIGWTYDRKITSNEVIQRQRQRHGDTKED